MYQESLPSVYLATLCRATSYHPLLHSLAFRIWNNMQCIKFVLFYIFFLFFERRIHLLVNNLIYCIKFNFFIKILHCMIFVLLLSGTFFSLHLFYSRWVWDVTRDEILMLRRIHGIVQVYFNAARQSINSLFINDFLSTFV